MLELVKNKHQSKIKDCPDVIEKLKLCKNDLIGPRLKAHNYHAVCNNFVYHFSLFLSFLCSFLHSSANYFFNSSAIFNVWLFGLFAVVLFGALVSNVDAIKREPWQKEATDLPYTMCYFGRRFPIIIILMITQPPSHISFSATHVFIHAAYFYCISPHTTASTSFFIICSPALNTASHTRTTTKLLLLSPN